MNKHTEIKFEEAIEQSLVANGGYQVGSPDNYDPKLGLFPDEVLAFVAENQPKHWESLVNLQGESAGDVLLASLVKELSSKHTLHVLRRGFKCSGKTYRLANFAPNTGMNPEAAEAYAKNRLQVIRQVAFQSVKKHPDGKLKRCILDLVLSVNGLPMVTMELKNPMTGQTVEDAINQYKYDRDGRDLIFKFKERALVHFAVDSDQAYMTTKLAGKETFFLPFNQGHENGAGNPPPLEGKYRTSYLWEEVLARDSLMDILARFLHLEVVKKKVVTNKGIKHHKKETMIFPRYHQLDAVRKLVSSSKAQGAGHNYLVQHSAGSGKSNSIAWLAHRLSSLHNTDDQKIFDTVVVITDRRVLDQQLQDTIYQFEHKQGVVQKIDENTQQLAKSLSGGVPIVISTIQKFPFITQAMETLAKKGEGIELDTSGKKFAVIVDEAHSSQSGETAMELRKVLNKGGIDSAIAEEFMNVEEDGLSEEAKKELLREMLKRPRQPNISFFAFTATPKFKTQAIFNEPDPVTNTPPFHHYSMRQAIDEGFIMDVLKNYTTYKTYYGLIKSIEDDPKVPKKEAALALTRFMSLHPHNIGQKVEIIIEHFRANTRHRIGGRAKAMVVTRSRLHAVRYKLAFDQYLKEEGYTDIKSLVAFSGTVNTDEIPGTSFTEVGMNQGIKESGLPNKFVSDEYQILIPSTSFTEVGMNQGIKESELPKKFASDEYQILLVAEKYQTGFDQPLLHTMYVDKRLSGIQAVQTLSRLNRAIDGKEETFVLDFINEPAEIYDAFKPYYETTPLGEATEPHQLYDLQYRLQEWKVFEEAEVTAFCEVWFKNRYEPTATDHQQINAILDQAVERYKELGEEDQELFKGQLVSFRNLYAFLAQIIPYQDSGLEKLYTYVRFLLRKLPRHAGDPIFELDDDVALKFYRLQKISEGSIDLSTGEADPLKGPTEVGTGKNNEEEITLSSLIEKLNERFGTEFTLADQLFFDQIMETALNNETLKEAANVNTMENFSYVFNKMLEGLFIERMEGNEEIFAKVMNDDKFRDIAKDYLLHQTYSKFRQDISEN